MQWEIFKSYFFSVKPFQCSAGIFTNKCLEKSEADYFILRYTLRNLIRQSTRVQGFIRRSPFVTPLAIISACQKNQFDFQLYCMENSTSPVGTESILHRRFVLSKQVSNTFKIHVRPLHHLQFRKLLDLATDKLICQYGSKQLAQERCYCTDFLQAKEA